MHPETDGNTVQGEWLFPSDLALFQEHFPGAPRVPGSLLIETMRSEACRHFRQCRVIGLKRFQFREFILPDIPYSFSLVLHPETACIICTLSSGARCMARGTLLVESISNGEK